MIGNGWMNGCLAGLLAACLSATNFASAVGVSGPALVDPVTGPALSEPVTREPVQRAIDEYTAAMETQDRHLRLEKFARAEQLFRQTIEGDAQQPTVRNGELYVNMGNAALQAERLGPAIAAYRRALVLDPQHAQARQNLDYARSLLPEWARREEASQLIDSLFFWRTMIARGRLLVLGACCFFLAAVLFAAGYARRRPLLRNAAVIPLLVWGVLILSLLVEGDRDADRNVVVVTETTVYAADSENSAPRLGKPLPSGAELSLLEQREQWSEIRLPDGRTGWVLSSATERL